jgi:hypothetical protein
LAVGAVFALYGVCSLYTWFANILGNIRFRPQPQSPPAADAAPPTHPSKLTLPTFWVSEPAAWFALAEAKFRTSNITSQRVMFDLLVAALPEKHLSQVMDIIKAIPAINPYEVLKLRLLEAHVLSDQEKMDALFQLGPLGDRKPSQLLASMLSVCPSGMELQPVFQYLFLQRLPQTLRTLLGEQECGDIRALAALADRLWASHKPQPHEVMAVQEPVSSEPQVAAVQPKKRQSKKKTGGGNGGGASSGNDGVLSHCAAKALFSCPEIISQRLESRIISNEPLENTEEESKII